MKRVFLLAAISAVMLLGAGRAQAAYLTGIMTPGVDNTLEDQSREAYVDVNNSGTFDLGDVLVGFARIDNISPVSPAASSNHVYAIFSQQVTGITFDFLGTHVSFGATTAAGLTLTDLVGASAPSNGMVALYDRTAAFPVDLIASSPGDTTGNGTINIFDYFRSITTNGTLELVVGLGTGATQGDDYFQANISSLTGFGLLADSSGLTSIPTSVDIAGFSAGMSILYNALPFTFTESVVDSRTGAVHQLAISGGSSSGEAGAANNTEWDNTNPDLGYNNPGGFIDKTNFIVHPLAATTPEPATFTIFAVGAGLAFGCRYLSRRKIGAHV